MEILRHIESRKFEIPKPVLTMGNFDGIHLGHQALLRRVVQDAKEGDGRSIVLTFEPHPLKILAPGRAPRLILTPRDKLALLRAAGVDFVIIQEFDQAFANLEAEEFVQRYLIDLLRVHNIWVGRDFRFGKQRKGRVDLLTRRGLEAGFGVKIMEPIGNAGERISSSRIRDLIERGELQSVSRLLGRYHFISGRVVHGHRRGRDLGFPTANIVSRNEVLPSDGIYATFLSFKGRSWPGVTSIGRNPTFGEGPKTIESYIFDFQGDLYGESVRLSFVKRIRGEIKFASVDLLVEQMKRDVLCARDVLREVDLEGLGGSGR